jgi:hypothetical protein
MAVEIGAGNVVGERLSLTGADAASFVDDVLKPSTDERRLRHLERSDETFKSLYSPEPISDLPASE